MIIQKATTNLARLQPPGRGSLASYKLEKYRSLSSNAAGGGGAGIASPMPRRMTSNPNSPLQRTRSARGVGHHEMVAPTDKLRRKHANKEILRRALTPPASRRMNLRWLNFRPTPSRLSNMSTAHDDHQLEIPSPV